jgi:antitoxin ParD1/3/4
MIDTAQRATMRIRKTKNVSLTSALELFIARQVASGRYRSASEVVRAALRLLEDHGSLEGRGHHHRRPARSPEMADGA